MISELYKGRRWAPSVSHTTVRVAVSLVCVNKLMQVKHKHIEGTCKTRVRGKKLLRVEQRAEWY